MDVSAPRQRTCLRRIDPLIESRRWDELVGEHPEATIFHSSAWMRVLWETYRYRPFYYASETGAENGGATRPAILALAEVDSWLTGRRGISLPFTDCCPIFASEEHSFQELWRHALELGRERKWRSIEVREVPESAGLPPSLQFYNHQLPLLRDDSIVFAAFESSVRRAIRKAEKSGVQVTIEQGESAVRTYYELHCLTRKKHGLPPQPLKFFLNISRHIVEQGKGFIALARIAGKPVAGAVFFQFGSKALYKFGASDPAADGLRPSNLVMWKAIAELCARGATLLDFGRTSFHNDGLRRYKLSWGSVETTVSYLKWSFKRNAFAVEQDRSTGFQNIVFRNCGSAISSAAGRILYRHIA